MNEELATSTATSATATPATTSSASGVGSIDQSVLVSKIRRSHADGLESMSFRERIVCRFEDYLGARTEGVWHPESLLK